MNRLRVPPLQESSVSYDHVLDGRFNMTRFAKVTEKVRRLVYHAATTAH